MPVEQKAWLMCNWVKGTHSQAFNLEVKGNSCLEGEAIEHRGTEKQQKCWQHPAKMKHPTSSVCQCEEVPCFVLGRKNTKKGNYRAVILDFELKFNLIVIPERKWWQNQMHFLYLLAQA